MVQRRSISSYDQYDRKKYKRVVREEGCEKDADEESVSVLDARTQTCNTTSQNDSKILDFLSIDDYCDNW